MRRSERIAAMTKLMIDRPNEVVPLTEFVEKFSAAKSTISEDVGIIRGVLEELGRGRIETVAGAAGGVRFNPVLRPTVIADCVTNLCQNLGDAQRILPGGFLYMSDLVASPSLMSQVGEVFATRFHGRNPTVVVTVETRGIPIALMTARALNVPLIIVRRVTRLSEGTVVTMNYVSGSAKRIQTMSLSRRALSSGDRVLVVDDFMKAGGTARGLIDLVGEFNAEVVGVGVLIETAEPECKLVEEYTSLAVLDGVDEAERTVSVRPSPWVFSGA